MHVCPAFFPTRGGIEVLVESILRPLADDYSIFSSVLAPRHHGERPDNLTIHGALVRSIDLFDAVSQEDLAKSFASLFSRVRKNLDFLSPDIVHIHGFSPLALAAATVARTRQLPVIAHVHGELDPGLPRHYFSLLENSDLILAVSEAVGRSIARRTSVTEERVKILRNGISVTRQKTAPPEAPIVLCVGRLEPEKGFDVAINALFHLRKSVPNAELRIIGSGYELHPLQLQASVLGLSHAVTFLGELSHEHVQIEMAKASLIVIPSKSTEGFSLVAAEAAALGRVTVGSAVGGLPETIVDGVTGMIVPPDSPNHLANAIESLLRNRARLIEMGNRGHAMATERFAIDKFVAGLAQTYQLQLAPPEHLVGD